MGLDVSLHDPVTGEELFDANITHNLGAMADEAGCYQACWHPEEIGATTAADITCCLRKAAAELAGRPTYYKQFDAPNGWGLHKHFLPWVVSYLEACEKYPDSVIRVRV